MTPTPQDLLPMLIMLCRSTGNRIAEIYNGKFEVEQKSDMTPVTCADIAAHCAITSGLSMVLPNIPILSEEEAEIPFETRLQWQRYWLIDPIDGTREFINRTGEFTINIALIENNQPVLGVVYAPVIEVCYYASRGDGAYKLIAGQEPQRLQTQACQQNNIIVTRGRCGTPKAFNQYIEHLNPGKIIQIGSSLKPCLIAEGGADIYPRFGPISEWDTAAAQCILEEAGGQVIDFDGNPLRYNTKESLLNPDFFAFGDASIDWISYLSQEKKS